MTLAIVPQQDENDRCIREKNKCRDVTGRTVSGSRDPRGHETLLLSTVNSPLFFCLRFELIARDLSVVLTRNCRNWLDASRLATLIYRILISGFDFRERPRNWGTRIAWGSRNRIECWISNRGSVTSLKLWCDNESSAGWNNWGNCDPDESWRTCDGTSLLKRDVTTLSLLGTKFF